MEGLSLLVLHTATEIKQMATGARELLNMIEVDKTSEYFIQCRGLIEAIEDHGTELIKNVEKVTNGKKGAKNG